VTARTIAVVSAGLGQPSSTRLLADKLAAATAGHLPAGTEVVTIELRDLAHDIVNALLTGFPAPALREAIEQVLHADALIAVTPLYSGSYNGLFKSFFDVLDPGALAGKTVLIAATGGTAGIPSRWSTRSARCPVTCARSRSPPRSSRPPRTGARRAAPARRSPPGSTGPQPSWPP
jgi:multimeric flavodoxin WrbA